MTDESDAPEVPDDSDATDAPESSEASAAPAGDGRRGPLTDLRVVDLTQMLAGPFATMLLADLGADVVKVEPPDGDGTRTSRPHLRTDEAYGGYFNSVNRNKRSVVVDLKSEAGREALLELVDGADVLVENYRAGTMERLDLSYETLSEHNPGLVYASIRGYGDPRTGESPHARRPAFDLVAQAMGGLMSINGTTESGPTKVGPGVGDIFPAVLCVVGILSALRHRDRTGEGQYVDVSMVDGVLSLCERIVHQHAVTGDVPGPQGNTHPLLFPFDRFPTADGHVVIAGHRDHLWTALCRHMGREEWIEAYPDREARLDAAEELRPRIAQWTRQHTKEEVFELIADDVPCGMVNDVADVFADPHFAAREMLPEVEHADTGETIRIAGTPIKLDETPGGVRHRAPLLGEHTREVLAEAGLDEDAIEALFDRGAVASDVEGE